MLSAVEIDTRRCTTTHATPRAAEIAARSGIQYPGCCHMYARRSGDSRFGKNALMKNVNAYSNASVRTRVAALRRMSGDSAQVPLRADVRGVGARGLRSVSASLGAVTAG